MTETRRRLVKINDPSPPETQTHAPNIVSDDRETWDSPLEFDWKFWTMFSLANLTIFLSIHTMSATCWLPIPTNPDEAFHSSSLVRAHLRNVTGLGPRTAGSWANEILAADYLRTQLTSVARQANRSGLVAWFDEQLSTPSSFRSRFHVSTYDGLRNFVLRFHDPRSEFGNQSKRAFMVNCHYDTVPNSPGASDTFVNCAIMLEVCRLLAQGTTRLYNDIIFLFNGAEEVGLLSGHAFVTQHPWAPDLAAFLNLEGAGAGNRLLVFQTGPGPASDVLLQNYAHAFKQPFANVFAETLFQSDVLPSDTDFRIFRDYGLIPGLDLAYVDEAYVYHTPFDTESRISAACLNQCGANLLRFVRSIAQDKRIQTLGRLTRSINLTSNDRWDKMLTLKGMPALVKWPAAIGRSVYFDLVGLLLVRVPWTWWKWFNLVMLACFVCHLGASRRSNWHRWCGLAVALLLQLLTQLCGLCLALLLGFVTHAYGCRMAWYSTQYNLVGAFVFPISLATVWMHTDVAKVPGGCLWRLLRMSGVCDKHLWTRGRYLGADLFDAALMILGVPLFVLTYLNSPACFVLTIWMCSTLMLKSMFSCVSWTHKWLRYLGELAWIIPALVFHAYFCKLFMTFLVPTTGRMGHTLKPDVIMACLVFFFMLPVNLFSSIWLQFTTKRGSKLLRVVLLNACLTYAILIHASPYGFPYRVYSKTDLADPRTSPRFQRMIVIHMTRFLRSTPDSASPTSTDSHIVLVPFDVNGIRYLNPDSYPRSMLSTWLSSSDRLKSADYPNILTTRCNASLPYCGLALPYPFVQMFDEFYFIPTSAYSTQTNVDFKLISRQPMGPNTHTQPGPTYRWNFTFAIHSGPPYTHVLVRTPSNRTQIAAWSFGSSASQPFPVPMPSKTDHVAEHGPGLHYYIFHINAQAQTRSVRSPWTFWLVLESAAQSSSFDLAVASLSMDLGPDSSAALTQFVSQLPSWIVPMTVGGVYDQWRFELR